MRSWSRTAAIFSSGREPLGYLADVDTVAERRRRLHRAGVAVAAVVCLSFAGSPAGSQEPGSEPAVDVAWHSAGDSYSSGEGVSGNQGACAQSADAYGPKAAATLRNEGWVIGPETFTACTSHLVEDMFWPREPGKTLWLWERDQKASLWDWHLDQGGPERVDVLTMSFGGNDIGFCKRRSHVPRNRRAVTTGRRIRT